MKLWAHDRFEIETAMTPGEIVTKLNSKIEPTKLLRFSSPHAPFQGKISQNGFKITRIIHYRNSFLPVISGKFLSCFSGTKVEINMGLHPIVIAFMCVWFGGVGVACIAFPVSVFYGKTSMSPAMLIPFGMLAFGWALVSWGFWSEVKKQKPMLIKMFNKLESSKQSQ